MTITPELSSYTRMIEELHANWTPHAGQVRVGQALFKRNIRRIKVACGRKWGKTELAMYFLTRWGKTYPGLGCWYVAPEQKQARNIIWEDPRVKNFIPRAWIAGINESKMQIRLDNGSFIQLDGSDNYEAHRGTRPGIIIYEESKDHKRRFREVMRPNMSVFDAPEIHIGTPPSDDDSDEAIAYWEELEEEFKTDPAAFYYNAPTWENPHIARDWLEKEKARLYRKGEGHVFEREYGAKRVQGGSQKIFPMLKPKEQALTPHDQLMKRLHRDRKKLAWFAWNDPAGATCFGVLFAAVNPYTRDVYWLDEIYEKDQAEMTVKKIGARVLAIRDELHEDRFAWRIGYDEAATWFANEWHDNFPDEPGIEPSRKSENEKLSGLSLLKDIMLAGKWHMSDRCQNFYAELNGLKKDDKGRIPKKNDHLIDDARYILAADGYQLNEDEEDVDKADPDFRGATIAQDLADDDEFHDPIDDFEGEDY